MDHLRWVMSEGGALIAMEATLQSDWGGICRLTKPEKNAVNDYERVPGQLNFIQTIDLRSGQALVFGEGPLDTAFWSAPDGENFVIRLIFCDSDFDANSMMLNFGERGFDQPDEEIFFRFFSQKIVMFDSSEDGSRSDVTSIAADFDPGNYQISTILCQPDDRTCCIIHSFRRIE